MSYKRYFGYSIIEMIVSFGIIIALSYGTFAGINHYYDAGCYKIAKTDLSTISMAVNKYRFEMGSFPSSINDLTVSHGAYKPCITAEKLIDPWNETYFYIKSADGSYAVWSSGKDKINQSPSPINGGFGGDDIGEIRK